MCTSIDSEILLGDGFTTMRMDQLKIRNNVLTVDKNNLSVQSSGIYNKFKKMSEKLLKITTISGRELKCTPDHPLLIKTNKSKYEMIEAGELKEGDCVIIKHTNKYLELDKETKFIINSNQVSDLYRPKLLQLNLLDREFTQNELEIMARLLGGCITDGHLNVKKNSYLCKFCVGEVKDASSLANDILKLGFDKPHIKLSKTKFVDKITNRITIHKTIEVSKYGSFAYFMFLLGAFVGKKTTQLRKLPEWIINANKPIIREFLGGLIGGDGCKIDVLKRNEKFGGYKTRIHEICQTTNDKYLHETIDYVRSMTKLFDKFGIKSEVIHKKISIDRNNVYIVFDGCLDNLNNIADYIGYRYCYEKERKSALPIEYIKCKKILIDQTNHKYQKLINMYKEGKSKSEISKEIKLNCSMISNIIYQYKTTGKIRTGKTKNFSDYEQFKNKYCEKDEIISIPIKSIEVIPNEVVCDFTTISNNHSFVANSFVVKNCFVETSEGHKVGLVKNLSMVGNVTVMKNSQVDVIKSFVKTKVQNIQDVNPILLKNYTRVLLNGEIIGLTDKPRDLYNELKKMKHEGSFDPLTGITHDIRSEIECKDLRINCDTGRVYHPVIRVAGNTILLTKEMIDLISIDDKESSVKITSWNQFMMKFPGVVEYIDADEKYNAMIAMFPSDIEEMRLRMINSVDLVTKLKETDVKNVVNRYDQFSYVKYTHCEIHPSLLLGVVVANIPFCECNQGPRNIYQYSQARQAMGIYATNYRERLDISYILYHPQRPIVTTRSMKYINSEKIPAGENCIVAIACFTGFWIKVMLHLKMQQISRWLVMLSNCGKLLKYT